MQANENLSGSKRPSKLDFSVELEENHPPKRHCVSPPTSLVASPVRSVMVAKQQFGHNEFHILELPGNWEPADSVYIAQLRVTMESLYCHLGGD